MRTLVFVAVIAIAAAFAFTAVALSKIADDLPALANQTVTTTNLQGSVSLDGFLTTHSHPGCVRFRIFGLQDADLKAAAAARYDVVASILPGERVLMCTTYAEGSR